MSSYLLDTNHCIYLMNGWSAPLENLNSEEQKTVETFDKIKNSTVYMSEVSIGELVYGVARSQKKAYNQKRLNVLLSAIPPIPITREVWEIYGETKAKLSKTGKTIPDMDLLVASTAKLHRMILVANDKHMTNLPHSFSLANWAK